MILAFDMDGTLCDSGQKIEPGLLKFIESLPRVAIVSGAKVEKIISQIGSKFIILAQSGNDAYDENGTALWRNSLTPSIRYDINKHIKLYAKDADIQDRGCQISVSLVGHNAKQKVKREYDPTGTIRRNVLALYPPPDTLDVRIGGTTCIDYTAKGFTKGRAIERLSKLYNDKVIYFGDQLSPGGNDESVIGVCETIEVKRK